MLNYELLTPAVDRAAEAVTSKFPAHHDIADVKQAMWVWIMENKNTVSRILADSEGTTVAVENLLAKAGNSYLKTEDAATYGYGEEDQFNFSIDLIKSILEVVFRHEDWQSFAIAASDGQPRAKSNPATAGNNLASYADVSRAVAQLSDDQYNLLVWRYKYQYTFDQIGAEQGVTKQTATNRHTSALSAIQKYLGKADLARLREGYDWRTADAVTVGRVTGNVNGQAVVNRDYNG
jgi:hypothetical protein